MKKYVLLFALILTILVTAGCIRKFTVASISKDFDFSVVAPYGSVTCTPVIDARSDFDRTGKVESSCGGGTAGVMHLGDKNYKNPLLTEFDRYLKVALNNSHLFANILVDTVSSATDYTFKSSLDKYQVTLNEAEAQQTQACVGGIIGAAIASGIDVTATSDIQLTGILLKEGQEVWKHTVSKQVTEQAHYSQTEQNAEKSMGNAIGETCKDLITEMAKYLAGQQ